MAGIAEFMTKAFGSLRNSFADKTGVRLVSDRLPEPRDPETDDVLDLPGYRQVEDFSCGFVAGLMVLHYFRPRASIDHFYNRVGLDPNWGASTRKVADALRASGIRVSVRDSLDFKAIAAAIEAGHPIVVTVKPAHGKDLHWAVVYGVGVEPRRIFLSGVRLPYWDRGKVLEWKEFTRKWRPLGNGLECSARVKRR